MGEGLIMSRSQQQACTSFIDLLCTMDINVVYVKVCSLPAEKIGLYSVKRLDSFSLPSFTQSVHLCTAETTTVVHLFPQRVDHFLCMRLWYISAVLPFVLVFPLAALHRRFDEALLSLLPTVTKKSLCVFYIFCCHPAPLEIRGPLFMHGFSECQLPTHLWIQRSMKEGWENQVFGQSHSSVVVSPQPQGTREEDETELTAQQWKIH